MKSKTFCLRVKTEEAPQFIDITDWVSGCISESTIANGFAVVFSKHTTAAVKINENEPLLLEDMAAFLEGVAPPTRSVPAQRLRDSNGQHESG